MELTSKGGGGGQFKNGRQKYEEEVANKSTIMIGQRDSEAGEVDKAKGTPSLEKKELKKGKWGIRRAEIVQKK